MNKLLQDPDFLEIYHSADEEWPGYKVQDDKNASLPLLISEIYRLIPYIGSEYVHFYPKNMPDVMINKVEIVGIVTDRSETMKYTSYTVDDATGVIPVLCKKTVANRAGPTFSRNKSKNGSSGYANAECGPEPPSGSAPGTPYSYERHIRDLWYSARYEKPLQIELYDYVHVIGFCAMNIRNEKDVSELTDEDMRLGRLFFFGINIRPISEADHNAMVKSLIINVVKERYLKPKSNDKS